MAWDDTKVVKDDFLSADWNNMVTDQKGRSRVYSGTTTPIGSAVPEAVGDIYIDTVAKSAYIATGPLNTDWELIDSSITSWGEIEGTLSNQTDLQDALDLKGDASDVGLNTTHRTSDGSDHSFIDQDVKTTSGPTFTEVTMTPGAAPAHSEGLMYYDINEKNHVAYNDISDVSLNIGEETWIRIVNKTGVSLTNGQIVYINGAQGNRPTVDLAQGNAESTSCGTIGVITQTSIADNDEGMITTTGAVRGYNTTGFAAGDELFLSEITPGLITNVAPISPNYKVRIGWALNSTVNGSILVRIKTNPHADHVFIDDVGSIITATDVEGALQENRTAIDLNTTDSHVPVTVTDTTEIDMTITGQDIKADIKLGSIDETKLDTSVNDSLNLADSAIQTETDPVYLASQAAFIDATDITNLGNLSGSNTGDQTDMSGISDTIANFNTALSDGSFAISGGAFHDGFSDYVANEHIDWTTDQGATNIDAGNYINTTYTSSDFNHDDLSGLTGTAAQYNHPTDANMTVLNNTSNTNTGDQTSIVGISGTSAQFDTANSDGNFIFDADFDAKGKILVGTGVGTWSALVVGTNDYVLTADSAEATGVKWAASSSGFSDPMTTRGDIIYRNVSNVTDRLAVGSAGTFLKSDGTDVSWATPSGSGDVVKVGTPVDNQIGVWTGDGTIEGTTGFTYNGTNLNLTGDIGATGTRITKGWFTDFEVTNAINGSITGNAATVTNGTLTTALTVNTGTVSLIGNVANTSALTIGAGAVSVSGSNTGDQDLTAYIPKSIGTTAGDIIYWTGTSIPARLPKGTATQVLTMNAGATAPEWANAASGFTDPMTTRGDIIYKNAAGTTTRLAAGTVGQVLTSDGTDIAWAAAGGGGAAATFERTYTGSISTGRLIPIIIPDELNGLDIKEVRLSLLGLPTGAALKVDVRKNGTATTDSIFTSDVEIEVATAETATNGVYQSGCNISGSTVGTAGTTIDSARDTLASDDVLWVYVTQVGSTIAGADLVVTITVA